MIESIRQKKHLQFILLVVVFLLLCLIITPSEGNWFWRLPPLIKGLPQIINDSVNYVLYDWWLIEVWDPDIEEYESKPLMNQVTRSASGVILFMIEFVREIFLGGVKTIVTFTGWDWATENEWALALSWSTWAWTPLRSLTWPASGWSKDIPVGRSPRRRWCPPRRNSPARAGRWP